VGRSGVKLQAGNSLLFFFNLAACRFAWPALFLLPEKRDSSTNTGRRQGGGYPGTGEATAKKLGRQVK